MAQSTAPDPPTDFDAALSLTRRNGGVEPLMLSILRKLPPDQAAKVEQAARAVGDDGAKLVSDRRIALALNAMGHKIAEQAVRTWRQRYLT